MNMVNSNYISTDDMFKKTQELKGKTKSKFYINLGKYYDNMEIRFNEDLVAKIAQGIS